MLRFVAILAIAIYGSMGEAKTSPGAVNLWYEPELQGLWYVLLDTPNDFDYPCTTYNLGQVATGPNVTMNVTYNVGGSQPWYWNSTIVTFSWTALQANGIFFPEPYDRFQFVYTVAGTDFNNYAIVTGRSSDNLVSFKLLSRTPIATATTTEALSAYVQLHGGIPSTRLVNQTASFCARTTTGNVEPENLTQAQLCQASKNPVDLEEISGLWYLIAGSSNYTDQKCTAYDVVVANGGANVFLNISAYAMGANQSWSWNASNQTFAASSVIANGTFQSSPTYTYQVFSTDYDNYAVLCGYSSATSSSDPDGFSFQLLSRTPTQAIDTTYALAAFVLALNVQINNMTYVNQTAIMDQTTTAADPINRPQMCEQITVPVNFQQLTGLWYELAHSLNDNDNFCSTFSMTQVGGQVTVNNTFNTGSLGTWVSDFETFPLQQVADNGTFLLGPDHEYQIVSTDYNDYVILCGYTRGMYLSLPNVMKFKILGRTKRYTTPMTRAIGDFLTQFNMTQAGVVPMNQNSNLCTNASAAAKNSFWLITAVFYALYIMTH